MKSRFWEGPRNAVETREHDLRECLSEMWSIIASMTSGGRRGMMIVFGVSNTGARAKGQLARIESLEDIDLLDIDGATKKKWEILTR